MSIETLSWVLKHSEAKLGARLVLIVLADHAGEDGVAAWPAVATIAQKSRLSRRAVQDALRKLEQDGAIRRRGLHGSGTVVWDVIMRVQNLHGVQNPSEGGADNDAEGGEAASPKPSLLQPSGETGSPERSSHELVGFGEWLEHHHAITGADVLKTGTQARRRIAAMYAARLSEGYSHEDLKLVVDGAWADDFRREKGHTGHESVLRPTKVADLISKGRRARADAEARSPYDRLED